ncbi:P-loop containing nucleoside triphosphate hydrolase protein [Meredithblackwellia eburnea MCA 4105]
MNVDQEEEEEVDELDAFMMGVQAQVKTVDKADRAKLSAAAAKKNGKVVLDPDADDGDDGEELGSEDEADKVGMSAADILALAAKKVKKGRELTAVDHSKMNYEPFRKAFYHAPPEVEELTADQVEELRQKMDGIKVRGADPPKPVSKWSYCGLPSACIDVIKSLEYAAPTSIQAQAIPAIMSGRDIIGVAKTGSGKTMAFILPMFRHIKDQRPLATMEGPIGMIMTPTRELATQIYRDCKPFLKALGLRATCAYGGSPLKDNIADMKRGAEIVVCTPGRMIELLTTNSGRIINLHRITYLVLDEADRMFDMGFEPQVMKIINQVRPDKQTVLFSATFPRQMEALARKVLRRPLEITVGGRSVVAPEIEQIVEVRAEDTKFNRTLELLGRLYNDEPNARALIFVERQESADKLLQELLKKNYTCMSLHGGMEQVDRDQAITDFKSGVIPIIIATSVAARGLDVKQLKLVIQYDVPNHMEDYVHRAGRTGRAGNKGTCVTFITPEQDRYSVDILKALTASAAAVPAELRAMAEAFAEKVKAGKASAASSGFGGKGLESLANDRDAAARAERAMFGDEGAPAEKKADAPVDENTKAVNDVSDLEVLIHKGPAPDTNKRGVAVPAATPSASTPAPPNDAAVAAAKAAEEAAIASGKPVGVAKAQSVIANFNAMLKAKNAARTTENDLSTDAARRRDPDATDYHAIIYINDYPQKARWKVTNKETMVHLVEDTGASITNKGVYYPPGQEPGPDELPKLHLLIESNDEFRVKHAIQEIKRALIEGATMALEAEARNPGSAPGRYSVV